MPRIIDVHVHPPREPGLPAAGRILLPSDWPYRTPSPPTVEDMAATYKQHDMLGVLFSINSESSTGTRAASNDWVASIVRRYPEQFIGFAAVDVWHGKMAVKEIERSVKELGLRGLKLHPILQQFYPNDRRFYPIYEKCAELGVPVLFHTGRFLAGQGMPGGAGFHLNYANPIFIDDVAADFPGLTIIMGHPAWPWQEEQLAIALHKANAYIDLAGWPLTDLQPSVVQYANTLLQDKVLYGSDYPAMTPEHWLRQFAELLIRDEVRQKILYENAKRVLKL